MLNYPPVPFSICAERRLVKHEIAISMLPGMVAVCFLTRDTCTTHRKLDHRQAASLNASRQWMPCKHRLLRMHVPESVPMQRMQLLETCSKVWLNALTKVKRSQDLSLAIQRAFSTNVLYEPRRLPN